MKKVILIFVLLLIGNRLASQQVLVHVFDPSAFAIRGVAIPGMLTETTFLKYSQVNTIIPKIIEEEEKELSKWRKAVFGNLNALNSLAIASLTLVESINEKIILLLPAHYAPGLRSNVDEFMFLEEKVSRLQKRVVALIGVGTLFIDGEGYYRVASQRLALEYIDVYAELSSIDFELSKLLSFVELLPLLAT